MTPAISYPIGQFPSATNLETLPYDDSMYSPGPQPVFAKDVAEEPPMDYSPENMKQLLIDTAYGRKGGLWDAYKMISADPQLEEVIKTIANNPEPKNDNRDSIQVNAAARAYDKTKSIMESVVPGGLGQAMTPEEITAFTKQQSPSVWQQLKQNFVDSQAKPNTPAYFANEAYWGTLMRGGGFDKATTAYINTYSNGINQANELLKSLALKQADYQIKKQEQFDTVRNFTTSVVQGLANSGMPTERITQLSQLAGQALMISKDNPELSQAQSRQIIQQMAADPSIPPNALLYMARTLHNNIKVDNDTEKEIAAFQKAGMKPRELALYRFGMTDDEGVIKELERVKKKIEEDRLAKLKSEKAAETQAEVDKQRALLPVERERATQATQAEVDKQRALAEQKEGPLLPGETPSQRTARLAREAEVAKTEALATSRFGQAQPGETPFQREQRETRRAEVEKAYAMVEPEVAKAHRMSTVEIQKQKDLSPVMVQRAIDETRGKLPYNITVETVKSAVDSLQKINDQRLQVGLEPLTMKQLNPAVSDILEKASATTGVGGPGPLPPTQQPQQQNVAPIGYGGIGDVSVSVPVASAQTGGETRVQPQVQQQRDEGRVSILTTELQNAKQRLQEANLKGDTAQQQRAMSDIQSITNELKRAGATPQQIAGARPPITGGPRPQEPSRFVPPGNVTVAQAQQNIKDNSKYSEELANRASGGTEQSDIASRLQRMAEQKPQIFGIIRDRPALETFVNLGNSERDSERRRELLTKFNVRREDRDAFEAAASDFAKLQRAALEGISARQADTKVEADKINQTVGSLQDGPTAVRAILEAVKSKAQYNQEKAKYWAEATDREGGMAKWNRIQYDEWFDKTHGKKILQDGNKRIEQILREGTKKPSSQSGAGILSEETRKKYGL